MNKRIKQLVSQTHLLNESIDLEQFAKLIVQDCVQVCKKEWYTLNNTESIIQNQKINTIRFGQKNGVLQCINSINAHFGVEK